MIDEKVRYRPIIYVRGYAMTPAEIDQTTADPFCGFNLGSTVYRAVPEKSKPPRKFVFESPLVRLSADFEYRDVYEDGYDILDPEWGSSPDHVLTKRSVIIFRYYDEASRLLGLGETPPITTFAKKLGDLILKVRDLVCSNPENKLEPKNYRCHLVAHSMGGLVCRALLQNPKLDPKGASRFVDKFFTYATPHNGIDLAGFNIPTWLSKSDINNFNREKMAEYLDLKAVFNKTERVDWLPESRFPASRVFCMVGTNRLDYEAGLGLSRTFVGHGSDGLVRIENATLTGLKTNGREGDPCAKAFTYRSHSGFFGIVNGEEAYQNLVRFLFGDVRVDIWLDIAEIRLPVPVQAAETDGKTVNALYQIELKASPRGKLWFLTRRTAEEDSVACLTHQEWRKAPKTSGKLYLSTVFLANRAKVNRDRPSLAYAVAVGIRVPDYEIDKKLWVDEHYEGGYLYRNSLVVELIPPSSADGAWQVCYGWQDAGAKPATQDIDPKDLANGAIAVPIPFDSETVPGVSGVLRFVVSQWNADEQT